MEQAGLRPVIQEHPAEPFDYAHALGDQCLVHSVCQRKLQLRPQPALAEEVRPVWMGCIELRRGTDVIVRVPAKTFADPAMQARQGLTKSGARFAIERRQIERLLHEECSFSACTQGDDCRAADIAGGGQRRERAGFGLKHRPARAGVGLDEELASPVTDAPG